MSDDGRVDDESEELHFLPASTTGDRYQRAVAQAAREGEILTGGERLREGALAKGFFVAPTVAKLPLQSHLFMNELFVPFLAIGEVSSLEQALEECNKAEYGLTAGIFSTKL